MKQWILTSMLAVTAGTGFAQEAARVISSTPIVTQVAVPRQVCSQQQVMVQGSQSGVGAVTGLAIGGAVGNRFGDGNGRAAATLIGAIGGAIIGDRLEAQGAAPHVQNIQNCRIETSYENRISGYNVVYEYAGRRYSTQTETDPGAYVQIQVAPAVASVQPYSLFSPGYAQPTYIQPTYAQPVYVQPRYVQPAYPVHYTRPSRHVHPGYF